MFETLPIMHMTKHFIVRNSALFIQYIAEHITGSRTFYTLPPGTKQKLYHFRKKHKNNTSVFELYQQRGWGSKQLNSLTVLQRPHNCGVADSAKYPTSFTI
jgi:hypothetical protein